MQKKKLKKKLNNSKNKCHWFQKIYKKMKMKIWMRRNRKNKLIKKKKSKKVHKIMKK